MVSDYLAVWRVLHWIDKDTFFKITQFEYDYYGTGKWIDYQDDYTQALMSYDSQVQGRFDDYIKEQL